MNGKVGSGRPVLSDDAPDDDQSEVGSFEPNYVDVVGHTKPHLSGHTPCDCDPQNVQDLKHEIAHAIRRDEEKSGWLADETYRMWLRTVYEQAKRCDECMSEELLIQFETVLENHDIID